jgi:PEGA domain
MRTMKNILFVLAATAALCFAETGNLKVKASPTGAGLFVDGKYVGPAGRFTLAESYPVEAGTHEIVLRDPRFEDFKASVTVTAGKTTKLRAKMKRMEEPKGPFGRLRLRGGESESFWSVAQGDTGAVFLNGRFMGHVDELNDVGGGLLLPAGTYELMIESQKFGNIKKMVQVEAGKVTRFDYAAKREE